jgi:hypothetical protein
LSSAEVESSGVISSIDSTLGNFNDAAPLFGSDLSKQFIGITSFPMTPVATRPMPPLAFPSQPKQSSSAFNANGVISSQSQAISNNNRTYNNNNPPINNVNSYPKSSSTLQLAPPPQSRAGSNSINTSNSNTFVRPSDNKPLMNGRSSYPNAPQMGKHEVSLISSVHRRS